MELEGLDDGPDDEGEVGQLQSLSFGLGLQLLPERDEPRRVRFVEVRDMDGLPDGFREPPGRRPADAPERNAIQGAVEIELGLDLDLRLLPGRFLGLADVVFRDPPAGPGPRYGGRVQAELRGELADRRRRQDFPPGCGRSAGRDGLKDRRGRDGRGLGHRLALLADGHEDLADLDDVLGLEVQLEDRAGEGRGDLDDGLVGLDLAQGLVDLDPVPFGDGPADDLALG